MRRNMWFLLVVLCAMLLALAGSAAAQESTPQGETNVQTAMGTAFTYQGYLEDGGAPVSGTCDLRFQLYDMASNGSPVGSQITKNGVMVTDGTFTVKLDFGNSAFNGSRRWLEVQVRCPSSTGSYTTLSPRQELTPTPYALHAADAWALTGNSGTTPGTNFLGTTDNQDLVIKTNSAEVIRVDTGGNVGIGTSNPQQKLHVAGVIRFESPVDPKDQIEMSTPGGWPGLIAIADGHRREMIFDSGGIRLLTSSSSSPSPATNGVTIDEDGKVGIGTNFPSARLEAVGTSGDLLRLTNPSSPTGPVVFRVDSSGQVFADAAYNCGLSSSSACLQAGQGADVAERIDVSEPVQPGDIIEIDPEQPGKFRKTRNAASPLVVGIVSTAPAITLGNHFDAESDRWKDQRPLLALAGRVPAKVTTENGPIQVGDLLVSANKPGYAMRCTDRTACVGAIVGKALEPLAQGDGLIQVAVSIQ